MYLTKLKTGVSWVGFLLEALEENLRPCLFQLLEDSLSHGLHNHMTLTSASMAT